MLEAMDGPIRLMVFGQMLLIALLVPRRPTGAGTEAILLLLVCVAAYLTVSGPWDTSGLDPVLAGAASLIPFVLWLVARTVFDDGFRATGFHWRMIAGLAITAVAIGYLPFSHDWPRNLFRGVGLVAIAHAVFLVIKGLPDDLVEARRSARRAVVGLAAILVASSLVVELALPDPADRSPLEPLNAFLILVCTTLFGWAVLRPMELGDRWAQPAPAAPTRTAATNPSDLTPRIAAFIKDGGLFEAGLTVATMAAQLGAPEYLLRRTINGQMGFRNFNAFLNHHRIAEAKTRLTDPDQARLPILTIAMDLGYGSIGPFNRAFREITGMTPSKWRAGGEKSVPLRTWS